MRYNKLVKEAKNNGCYFGCRVSSSKQAQYGESLEDQEKSCRLYANKLNFSVVKIYSAQHTATKKGDSFIDDIIEDIKKQPVNKRGSYFIIKSIDRFCRAGTAEYYKLKHGLEELGIKLLDVYGVIQPQINTLEHLGVQFPWSMVSPSKKNEIMKAQDAEEEVSTILTRMIGAEVSLVQGGYKVRGANDGFVNKKIFVENKKKVIQDPDPARAIFFIKMFEMSITHRDQEVVDFVNAMGYRSRVQNSWSGSKDKKRIVGSKGGIPLTIKQLQKIRQRPIYCGINTEKWLQAPIKTQYPGLISISTFNKANKGKIFIEEKKDGSIIIHKDYNPHQLKRTKDNPLFPHKEVVLCPECIIPKPFLGSSPTGKSGKGFPVYHCARNHKYFGVNKKEFEKQLTAFVTHLKYKDVAFFKSFEATLINKFREKEKELGEASVKVGATVAELEAEKNKNIEAFTSTKNEIIRAELEKKIEVLHLQIENAREHRNSVEVQENDIHDFVKYVKDLMEHPVERLVKQKNLTALKGLFRLVFEELPTYSQIVNGTPKLSLPYRLAEEFRMTKSLPVTSRRIELRFQA